MKTFLEYVAEDILAKHGSDLSRTAVVFPNKRASLFMNEHLARQAGKPIWSPAYITISDLFRQHSTRQVADPIKLVCDLHKSFVQQTGTDETLDHFYGWGQLLLADFDDLDKNMADAEKVFANLRDIHELDDVSYLNDEQREIIRRFFSNFSEDHNSLLKERFIRLWSNMTAIYRDFNHRLEQQQLAYEGALYREVATRFASEQDTDDPRYDTYIFVGFNLLQKSEQQLFTALQKRGKARFYWDFDHYYMKGNEAGHYIGTYLAHYPNELDINRADIYHHFSRAKHIAYVSAPTENIQARYISTWLQEGERISHGRRTAIVMCNENLLQTVIHCLPDQVQKVNITTGYPLAQAPVASLVMMLVELQTIGYNRRRNCFRQRYYQAVMRHPYMDVIDEERLQPLADAIPFNATLVTWICDLLQTIARQTTSDDPLFQESVFRAYTLLNRLLALINDGDLQVDIVTLQRLIGQLIQSTSIPFHGEPAEGLQVMGVLETRNIDFDHVLLLSCNEGNLPKGVNDTSFIPYNIRKAHGLTTIDHKVDIFSYYFHRLLQRAGDVTILYNNATTDGVRGEMSRFMLQLMVEDKAHDIQFKTLQAGQAYTPFHPKAVEKTPDVIAALQRRFDIRHAKKKPTDTMPLLTPTAINRYMRCPLMFYYNYVYNLREPDAPIDETIDNRIFGNIFHEASQAIYTRMMEKSRHIVAEDIDQLLKTKVDIERAVDEAMQRELMLKHAITLQEMNGLQIINREVIIHYLRQLLTIDRRLTPFTVIGLETDVVEELETAHVKTTVGGRIDRLDSIVADGEERIRVVDYKTGGGKIDTPLKDVEAIFQTENLTKHSDYYLQTFVYANIVRRQHPQTSVSPALLFIQHAGTDDYDPTLCFGKTPISDIADSSQDFDRLLHEKIEEMFSPDIAFVPTDDRERCRICPYKLLCQTQ